jgi:hypothetical protein
MTVRNKAMYLLAFIILLELAYYMIFLVPNQDSFTVQDLKNEEKMQRIFNTGYDDLMHGEQRRTRYKYVMGTTVILGFLIVISLPNKRSTGK